MRPRYASEDRRFRRRSGDFLAGEIAGERRTSRIWERVVAAYLPAAEADRIAQDAYDILDGLPVSLPGWTSYLPSTVPPAFGTSGRGDPAAAAEPDSDSENGPKIA